MTKGKNMNLIIKLIIKPLQSLLKLLFNRIFYVALALIVQLAWLLIALFRLMEYSRWVTIGMQAAGFLVVLWIVNKKINPSYKLAWTMLILVFPVFGVSLYLLFGKSRIGTVMEQHYQKLINETAEYLEGSESTRNHLDGSRRVHGYPVRIYMEVFQISCLREHFCRIFSGRRRYVPGSCP